MSPPLDPNIAIPVDPNRSLKDLDMRYLCTLPFVVETSAFSIIVAEPMTGYHIQDEADGMCLVLIIQEQSGRGALCKLHRDILMIGSSQSKVQATLGTNASTKIGYEGVLAPLEKLFLPPGLMS